VKLNPPRRAPEAFLSLGANLGDREENLIRALQALRGRGIRLGRLSGLYETEPVGREEQPDFLNMVVRLTTLLPPLQLLTRMQEIEQQLGRVRHERWGARTIDLDLLCMGGLIWRDERLVLPHPRLHERRFVLVPFAEIAADYEVPGTGATVKELLRDCRDPHRVRLCWSAEQVQLRMRKARA